MTIGEKIARLRAEAEISQEELAERLSVSRQAISKWETNNALPSLDIIPTLCGILSVSADELLIHDELLRPDKKESKKYFGTDGFRGEANISLTPPHAYKVGRFLGWYYSQALKKQNHHSKARIVIGKDTRRSSYMLEYAIASGIAASGSDAYMLHVTTTPSVSYVTRQDSFDCGIMITASHNPFYDNGIKVINGYGEKLDEATTSLLEAYLNGDIAALGIKGEDIPLATGEQIGQIVDHVSGRNRYIAYIISLASHSYKSLKIGLDCANGASWMIAKSVFSALGAVTELVGNDPDGVNINKDCGSTHIERLCRLVKEKHLDIGFAFDGDADRCIAVDECGRVVDGDAILYILGKRLKSRGMLNKNTVVATVMSNSGFIKSLENEGISCIQTKVGDRYVYEEMQNGDYDLGGEQSGHIIIKKYATTGDGLLTAIMVTEELCDTKCRLSELCERLTLYPQYVKNIRVRDKRKAICDPRVQKAVDEVNLAIGGKGRVLLRESGTEPVVRIMIECESYERCSSYAEKIANAISDGGHGCD